MTTLSGLCLGLHLYFNPHHVLIVYVIGLLYFYNSCRMVKKQSIIQTRLRPEFKKKMFFVEHINCLRQVAAIVRLNSCVFLPVYQQKLLNYNQ